MNMNRRNFLSAGATVAAGAALQSIARAADAPAGEPLSQLGKTPHTKFACNIEMWWRKLPFLQRIENAASFGYPAIEFWNWKGRDFTVEQVAETTKRLGIEVSQISGPNTLNDPTKLDAVLEAIDASCKAARTLGAKLLTVIAGQDLPGMTQDEMHGHVITALRRAVPILEKHAITAILEPFNIRVDHPGHCLYGSPPALRICRAVNSPLVKLNWDLYHMHITEGDLCGRLREGFDCVGYLQLADHPGRNEPGTGEIHYNRVLQEAYNLGYRGYVGTECVPKTDELTAARAVAAADVW